MADEEYEVNVPSNDESQLIKTVLDQLAECNHILAQQPPGALKRACEFFPNPELKDAATKQKIVDFFVQVFALVPPTEQLLKELPGTEERSNLLKASYKVMQVSGDKKICDYALLWNNHIIKMEGPGIVGRTLTDRNL